MRSYVSIFVRNGISLVGTAIATAMATLFLVLLLSDLAGWVSNPYFGLLLFVAVPAAFVVGLLLIPLGHWRDRRRRRRAPDRPPSDWPVIDLRLARTRTIAVAVLTLTVVNLVIVSVATYGGVHYMETTAFCGTVCHTTMEPEFVAHQNGPHARVACAACHVGPGVDALVASKLAGTRQLWDVVTHRVPKPVPPPIATMRTAQETCEQCHWPEKFHGDKFLVRTKYADDEANTASTTVLVLKIGGRNGRDSVGIHGTHLDPKRQIDYVSTDGRRQVIPQVTVADAAGTRRYDSTDVHPTAEQLAEGERRRMDCMDCHNRPTHAFELPERALDRALSEGRVSAELPYIKKISIQLLRAEYPDQDTAARRIAEGLGEFYRASYPAVYQQHRSAVETAAAEVQAIYRRNVFPGMKVAWGTYPNNIGHEDFLGCFRCHDESHKRADGRTITQDCNACHTILAQDESNPKVLSDLGLK